MATAETTLVTLALCDLCLDGAGGECHTPGCALWMSKAPDVPLRANCMAVDGLTVVREEGGSND